MDSMSRTGETKSNILKLLGQKNRTLSEISSDLGLAPSTISQHLQELEISGAIEEVENEHIRKWKYYRLNPNYKDNEGIIGAVNRRVANSRMFYYVLGVFAIVAIAYFASAYLNFGMPSNSLYSGNAMQSKIALSLQGSTYVPLRLTDPPKVPEGTSALMINYSSIGVRSNSTGQWIYSNASGSVNLMSLVNVSQMIGGVNVNANDSIDMARFNITSATIIINGTSYNVTVPNSQVSAHIVGSDRVNSSNGVLLDFAPVVAAIYTNTSTVFVMVPSLKAVIVPNPQIVSFGMGKADLEIGNRYTLNGNDRRGLNYANANLSMVATSMAVGNGTVLFSVTVKNSGNRSVEIDHVSIFGNETPLVRINGSCMTNMTLRGWNCRYITNQDGANAQVNGYLVVNTQAPLRYQQTRGTGEVVGFAAGGSANDAHLSIRGGNVNYNDSSNVTNVPGFAAQIEVPNVTYFDNKVSNGMVGINDSAFFKLQLPIGSYGQGHAYGMVGVKASYMLPIIAPFRAVIFGVNSNGTLSAWGRGHFCMELAGHRCDSAAEDGGYTIAPGQSMTFSYNGTIVPGNAGLRVSLIPGDRYIVFVQGEGEAAQGSVIAS